MLKGTSNVQHLCLTKEGLCSDTLYWHNVIMCAILYV